MRLFSFASEHLISKITEPMSPKGGVDVRNLDVIIRRVSHAPEREDEIRF